MILLVLTVQQDIPKILVIRRTDVEDGDRCQAADMF
jgi:hypothetical protein